MNLCISFQFKTFYLCFLLLSGFWEISTYLAPRVIDQSHFKRMFNFYRSTNNWKKMHSFLTRVYSSCTAEHFKVILQCVRDIELTKYNTLQPFEKTKHQCTNLVRMILLLEFDVLLFFACLIFWSQLLEKWLEAAIHFSAREMVSL